MPMQSRNNDKIFQLIVHMLDTHDDDAPMRCMIAMVVQCNDGMFHAQNEMVQLTRCNCHDADPLMHTHMSLRCTQCHTRLMTVLSLETNLSLTLYS